MITLNHAELMKGLNEQLALIEARAAAAQGWPKLITEAEFMKRLADSAPLEWVPAMLHPLFAMEYEQSEGYLRNVLLGELPCYIYVHQCADDTLRGSDCFFEIWVDINGYCELSERQQRETLRILKSVLLYDEYFEVKIYKKMDLSEPKWQVEPLDGPLFGERTRPVK